MRVSIRKEDPGYNLAVAYTCTILLDGKDITLNCFTADEEKGIAMCYKRNSEGKVYIDNEKLAEEILYGEIEIRFSNKTEGKS